MKRGRHEASKSSEGIASKASFITRDLGKAIGSSRQTISLIERGLCTIYRIVVKIAQIFNVPVEEIFTLVEGRGR